MKILYCWRCKMDVPMLDEVEFKRAAELYKMSFYNKGGDIDQRRQPLLDYYKEITGWEETVANAVMHHRIELYGPPCEAGGKPYRTPLASFCAACGNKRLINDRFPANKSDFPPA